MESKFSNKRQKQKVVTTAGEEMKQNKPSLYPKNKHSRNDND